MSTESKKTKPQNLKKTEVSTFLNQLSDGLDNNETSHTHALVSLNQILRHPQAGKVISCLLYTSPSPRDRTRSRMPSSA